MAYSLGQPYEWPIRFIAIITSALVIAAFFFWAEQWSDAKLIAAANRATPATTATAG